jgi:glycosyltransferase involved in cell wall biosynthesis
MTLRVLLIADEVGLPSGFASSVLVGRLARGLGHAGASAHVFCLDYTERDTPPLNTLASGALGEGATFEYLVPSPVLPVRVWNIVSGRIRSRLRLHARVRAEVVPGRTVAMYYGRYSSVLLHVMAICRTFGVPLINFLVEWRLAFADQTLAQRGDDAIFHRALGWLDGSLVISKHLETLLRARVPAGHRILRIPVLADPWAAGSPPRGPHPRPYALLCADLDSYSEDARFAVDAVAGIPGLDLVLVGKADTTHQALMEHARLRSCEPRLVICREFLSEDELRSLYAGAVALLAPLHDDDRARARFPSKLADYLSAGVPVVSNRVGEAAEWLEDGESAFLPPPDDVDAFRRAILQAWTHPERERVAARGQALATQVFHYQVQGEKVRSFLEGFVQR